MSSSERLRLRMEASTKVIAPRPLKDASMATTIKRYVNTAVPTAKQSDGQMMSYSSEIVAAAKAGCAICATPNTGGEIQCCPLDTTAPKALALQGKSAGCCPIQGGRPPLPECCSTPGSVNSWWANNIPGGIIVPLPQCRPCPPARNPNDLPCLGCDC
jgi:hypothetical protein